VVARRILVAECPQGTPEISPPVMALFNSYAWPGNIRQLANVLRTAAVMAAGESRITEQHLSDDFLEDVQRAGSSMPAAARGTALAVDPRRGELAPITVAKPADKQPEPVISAPPPVDAPQDASARTLGEAEIDMIRSVLAAADGNISVASKRLGISRNTIYRKLRWGKN
jgi:transcriptional regulator of acetoin/glycerol metabolism